MRIDPVVWPTLSALLDDYLDQPEEVRAAWLDGLGPEYADILPTLRELVSRGAARGDAFLDTLPAVTEREGVSGYAPLAPGSVVGPYRLIRELGRGGMSHVWLAERVDGLIKRKVALKLSNILVNGEGEIRLLDFGIAKLLVEGEAAATELTRAGGCALTPEYASPEQLAGLPVTKASDVFSLGLVLFELLTGDNPRKHTRDADPVRPSQALGRAK